MGDVAILDDMLKEYFPRKQDPGAAAMLWLGDQTICAARGVADQETGEQITSQTNFRLASVSKQFTAACILQLCERGLLQLDASLSDVFSAFPKYGKLITIEHLLRHTSGVKDYEKLISEDRTEQVTDADVLQMLAAEEAGDFLPGEMFRYSNSGYAVLAMVVEAISKRSFADYLNEHVFAPLGMSGTLAYVNASGLPSPQNRAIGYEIDEDGAIKWSDQNVTTGTLGDGGIYCSAGDYANWISGYLAGRVISADMLQRALLPTRTTGGDAVPYGYGWRLESMGDVWLPYHPGSTSGFRNGVLLDHDQRWAVLVLSNRRNGDSLAVARHIAEVFGLR